MAVIIFEESKTGLMKQHSDSHDLRQRALALRRLGWRPEIRTVFSADSKSLQKSSIAQNISVI